MNQSQKPVIVIHSHSYSELAGQIGQECLYAYSNVLTDTILDQHEKV